MSGTDIEIVRSVYERWGRGDFATPDVFDPDVQTIWADEIPGLNESRGLAALGASVRTWLEAWERCSIEAESLHEGDGCVVVLYLAHARHRGSTTELDWRGAHVWTMRDGKAIKLQAFIDPQEAAADAGIVLP
jgi:ketosteroid isomerase-like protein